MDEEQRVHAWLKRHGISDLELTPLIRARITARQRAERANWVGIGVLLAIAAAGAVVLRLAGVTDDDLSPAALAASYTGGFLALNIVVATMFWRQQHADRRIARGLRHRVTRSEAIDLNQDTTRSARVTYGGGILFGAAVVVFSAENRALSAAFLTGTVLFAGSTAWLLRQITRRPAVADDEASLRLDDRFRELDANRASMPFPLLLAVVIAINSGPPLRWIFLGYAAATLVAGVVLPVRSSRADSPQDSPA